MAAERALHQRLAAGCLGTALLHARIEPTVAESLTTRPSRERLRDKRAPFAERGLADPKWTDDPLLDFIEQHAILLDRPIVETPLGTALCRPSEAVLALLPVGQVASFTKEDGELVIDEGTRLGR